MCYCKLCYLSAEEWWEGVGYFPLGDFQDGLLALGLQNFWLEVGREMLSFTGSLGEGPGKQGERKGTAGEFGSMVKGCDMARFGVIFQEWRVTRDRDTRTQVRGQKG